MMPATMTAMAPLQMLQTLSQTDPKNKRIVDFVLAQGMTPQEVAAYVSGGGFGLTEQQRSDFGRKMSQKRNLQSFLDVLKNAAAVALPAYGAYKGVQLARSVLGKQPLQNMASSILKSGASAQASQPSTGANVQGIVSGIASIFGFRSKPLINAVSQLVQETGKTVQEVYEDLAKNHDLSTPEKAEQAAQVKIAEIQGEQTAPISGKTLTERHEKMKTIKPAAELKKSLAKDMKSSVIRRTNYNPNDKTLTVIFNNGHTYEYDDFPEDEYRKLTAGTVAAKTSGENQYGAWWVGKSPSAGASFNALVKAPGYNYRRVGDTAISKEEETELAAAGAPKAAAEKIVRPMERVEEAAGRGKEFAGKGRLPLTEQQRANRMRVLRKNAAQIRSMEPSARREALLESTEQMLHELEHYDKILSGKKVKLVDKENARFQKDQAKKFINTALLSLPAAVVKQLKDKVETMDATELLKLLRKFLKK